MRTRPDQPDWDRFIQWIYSPAHHGIMFMVDSMWGSHDVVHDRLVQGTTSIRDAWLVDADEGM